MCELFGYTAPRPVRANHWLREFYSHSGDHPDGWGLATFHDGIPSIEKEPVRASLSPYLASRLTEPVEAANLLAHIRKATVGANDRVNCHPFVGRDNRGRVWTLEHNGTIFRGDVLGPYFAVQEGRTDSERLLLLLLDRIGARQDALGRALGAEERFAEFAVFVRDLAPGNKLNLLVFDGETLYAHTNCAGSLHVRFDPSGAAVLSTRPLGSGDGWEPLPLCTPLAFRAGDRVAAAPCHGHEYVPTPDDFNLFFTDYATL
ncbi:MAG: class II glutamine amidotransferase [Kiritimatiellae bacterium]|nr:class II glutamine amidotransferase [Kiritimatiellia bacterium]